MARRSGTRWSPRGVVLAVSAALAVGCAIAIFVVATRHHRAGWYVYRAVFAPNLSDALFRLNREGATAFPPEQIKIRNYRPMAPPLRVILDGRQFTVPVRGTLDVSFYTGIDGAVGAPEHVNYWCAGPGGSGLTEHPAPPQKKFWRTVPPGASWRAVREIRSMELPWSNIRLSIGRSTYDIPRGAARVDVRLAPLGGQKRPLRLSVFGCDQRGRSYNLVLGPTIFSIREGLIYGIPRFMLTEFQRCLAPYGLSPGEVARLVHRIISERLARMSDLQLARARLAITASAIRSEADLKTALWWGILLATSPPCAPGPAIWVHLPKGRLMLLQNSNTVIDVAVFGSSGKAIQWGFASLSSGLFNAPWKRRQQWLKSGWISFFEQHLNSRAARVGKGPRVAGSGQMPGPEAGGK